MATAAVRCGVDHWVFTDILRRLDHRVRVSAGLKNGMSMEVFWHDVVGETIRRDGEYEPETTALLHEYLRPGSVFFDIGANVGFYTLTAAGLGAEVHAFEPDPRTFSVLADNVRANALGSVHLNQLALSDSPGQIEFAPGGTDNVGSGSLARYEAAQGRGVVVECETLDSYFAKRNPGRVALVKIDVEGAETLVLRGGSALLSQRPPMVIEYSDKLQRTFGSSNEALTRLLKGAGYDLYRVTSRQTMPYDPRDPDESFFNVLCLPAGSRA